MGRKNKPQETAEQIGKRSTKDILIELYNLTLAGMEAEDATNVSKIMFWGCKNIFRDELLETYKVRMEAK